MPPVTPRAMCAMSLLGCRQYLLDLALADFLLREAHQLLASRRPGTAAAQQLFGARAGQHHEFERIGNVGSIDHLGSFRKKVSTTRSACARTARCRDRSARTMAASRVTQGSSSSLMTT